MVHCLFDLNYFEDLPRSLQRSFEFGKVAVEILGYSNDLDLGMVAYLRFYLVGDVYHSAATVLAS